MNYSISKHYLSCFVFLLQCDFSVAHHLSGNEHVSHHGFWALLLILLSVIFSTLSVWSAKFLDNSTKKSLASSNTKKGIKAK